MADKDRDLAPESEDEIVGDEELDEEQDLDLDAEDETEESEAEAEETAAAVAAGAGRTGRGKERAAAAHDHLGSVRESHDRVHIDDRASAIFALVCAGALIAILALAWAGQFIPKGATPTLTPLVVPTSNLTAAPSASVAPSVSVAP